MQIPSQDGRWFASDNHSGAHPAVLHALERANRGHAPSYGDDPITARARELFRSQFGDVEVYFVFNGTGANVVSLRALLRPYQAVVCATTSHLQIDECGAPEHHTGCKLLTVPSHAGKVRATDVLAHWVRRGDPHYSQPRVISIAQSTEYGTVYTLDELRDLACFARDHEMLLHMDGARLANAAAALDCSLAALTRDVGIDILSFGGTKNGLLFGDAVVVFQRAAAAEMAYLRKQSMQLCSKMRFVAAQYVALFTDDLWLRNATQANAMASLLADRVRGLPGVEITQPVEANVVFARIPAPAVQPLMERFPFYVWNERTGELRWMTSFDTEPADVDAFATALAELVS